MAIHGQHEHMHGTTRAIVADGIVAQVLDELVQKAGVAAYADVRALHAQRYVCLARSVLKPVHDVLRDGQQVHVLRLAKEGLVAHAL